MLADLRPPRGDQLLRLQLRRAPAQSTEGDLQLYRYDDSDDRMVSSRVFDTDLSSLL